MAAYILDTNYLVYLYDKDSDKEKRKAVLLDMAEKLAAPDTRFLITPLIRYEVLRGVDWEDREKLCELQSAIEQFESLDITQAVSDLARDLYRFDKFESRRNQPQKNLDKRKFDIFHFATAKENGLEVLSKDTDVEKINELFQRMKS